MEASPSEERALQADTARVQAESARKAAAAAGDAPDLHLDHLLDLRSLLRLTLPLLLLFTLPYLLERRLARSEASIVQRAVPPGVRVRSSSDALLVRGEADFCEPVRDYAAEDPSHSIMRFLHAGNPPYWVCVPAPDHISMGETALKNGGRIDYGLQVYQQYLEGVAKDAIVFDIGANLGHAGLPMAATGRHVISFEPVPANQRIIQLGVCLNGFFGRYTLVKGALGEVEGDATMYIPTSHWTDNAALSQVAATENVGGQSTPTPVHMFALDAFAAKHMGKGDLARVGFVKLDVQGHETAIFRGGKAFFAALAPGTWVVAEHDVRLMNLSGFAPHEDVREMLPWYTVHGEQHGQELASDLWNTKNDLWYKRKG
jgi:FkbM family methyltransferase